MAGKISGFIREYIFGLSIITLIFGLFLVLMGIIWLTDIDIEFIRNIGEWNAYLLVAGFIIFFIGLYYLYSFLKNKKFVLKELKTNKRSELLKKHKELKIIVKHLPSKYRKMLKDKEDELKI